MPKHGLAKVLAACAEVIKIGSCSIELIGNYLEPQPKPIEDMSDIVIKDIPSSDCKRYNQVYLKELANAVN